MRLARDVKSIAGTGCFPLRTGTVEDSGGNYVAIL